MESLLNRKTIIVTLLLIALGIILFWYLSLKNDQVVGVDGPNTQGVTVPQVDVPQGWKAYTDTSNRWNRGDLKVAFAYPSTWTVNEEKRSDGSLNALIAEGDGYLIRIDQAGRGMNRPYDYIRSIGGFDARTWKEETDTGTNFTFGIISINFIVYVTTQNENQETLDRILSNMIFYK